MIDEVPQEPGQRPPGGPAQGSAPGPAQGAAPVPQPTSPSAWPDQSAGQWTPPQQPYPAYPQQPYPQQQAYPPPQQPGQQWGGTAYPSGTYQPGPHPDSAPPQQQWSAPPQQTGWQGAPASGVPYAEQPSSGVPAQDWSPAAGGWGAPQSDPNARRIVPSEPSRSKKLPILLTAGIVVAAVAAGAGGYWFGSSNAEASPQPGPTVTGAPSTDLPPYEASQVAINRTKLDGDLEPLAAPWLNVVGGCVSNGDKDGPKLGGDESRHTFCRYSAVSLHFIVFKSGPERDSARTFRSQLNLNSDGIAPGIEPSGRKAGGATSAQGKYVEYAYRDGSGRALCGLWWERDDSANTALLMETPCEESLGGKWEPLRDLWKRHS